MTTAKLNMQHDYMTVRATFSKDLAANLTLSRSGTKVSGKGLTVPQMHMLMDAFEKLRVAKKHANYGELMEAIRGMAEKSHTVLIFVGAMLRAAE